jgi:glucokinase
VTWAKDEFTHAGTGDEAALGALKWFYRYFAHFLSDQACIFMPMGGIYLTSSVINATQFLFDDPDFKRNFIETYLTSRGAGMSTYFKSMPIYLINDDVNLALRGCITYAKQNGFLLQP